MKIEGGGMLTLLQENGRVSFDAQRKDCHDGLYKIWLRGEGGKRCLLGTLVPEGNGFRIRRTVAVRELSAAGCWPIAGAEAICAFSFLNGSVWRREEHPERLFGDTVLRRQIKGPMLYRTCEKGFQLAAGFQRDRPVALVGLFCLAHVAMINGQRCLVWDFDHSGCPQLWDITGNSD